MKFALDFGPGSIVYVVRRRTLGYEAAHGMVEEIRANTDGIFVRVTGFGVLPKRFVYSNPETAECVCRAKNTEIERDGA